MALNPENLPSDKKARELSKLYRDAQRDLAAMVERMVLAGQVDSARLRRLQLRKVLEFLDDLGRRADPVALAAVEGAFNDGGALAGEDLTRLGAVVTDVAESTFASVNREAMLATQDAILGRLQAARQSVGRSVDDVFARATRQATARALLGVEGSPSRAARRLERTLLAQGQTAFTDRAGRRWKLADYADMAVRTTTREAVVAGQVNRLAAHGINLVRVSTHADSCSLCKPYEGRLIDLAGTMTEWNGEPVASGPLPPFHPRCAHTVMGVSQRVEAIRRAEGLPPGGGGRPPAPPGGGGPPGTRVADKLTPSSNAVKQLRDRVSGRVARVHRLPPGMPTIPLDRRVRYRSSAGEYWSDLPGIPGPNKIAIRSGRHEDFALMHELGHFIDQAVLSRDGISWASESRQAAIVRLMNALHDSRAVRSLESVVRTGEVTVRSATGADVRLPATAEQISEIRDYWLDRTELFARAYSQWIAQETQDADSLVRVREWARHRIPKQWERDDFEQIAAALDALFRGRGLR